MSKRGRFNLLALVAFTVIVAVFVACGDEAPPGDDTPTGEEAQAGSGSSGTGTTPSGDKPAAGGTVAEGTIAFASDRGRDFDIYVMNADGSDVRWPREKSWDWFTKRSPDGQRVASTYPRAGNVDVYVENADGSGRRWLTDDPGDDLLGGWSPDGRRIAFHSDREGNFDIYVINADGSGLTRLTDNPGDDRFGGWSPDGRRIAFESDRDGKREVYVMNADGSGVTRLTDYDYLGDDLFGGWSPDGRRIAFDSSRGGNADIYVMNADGSGVTRLTDDPALDRFGGWSPDGRHIAFDSERDGNDEVYVMNADGSGETRLTDDPGKDQFVAWVSVKIEGPPAEVQIYAEALEEAFFYLEIEADDEIEAAGNELFSSAGLDLSDTIRLNALATSDSWSEEDAEFASEYAEAMLQATSGIYDVIFRILDEFLHRVSSLRPPERLSGLHGNFIATYEETVRVAEELVETVKNADTEIKSREDLDDFLDLEFGLEVPEELEAQSEKACLELKEQLEAELERKVFICDRASAASEPTAPGATAEPAVRPTAANRYSSATEAPAAPAPAADTAPSGAYRHTGRHFGQHSTVHFGQRRTVPHLRGKDRRLRRMLGI